jgi:hypothetical protein
VSLKPSLAGNCHDVPFVGLVPVRNLPSFKAARLTLAPKALESL